MGFITDYAQLNAADDYQDWTYDNWSPTDNDAASNTPIYIEGSSCQWWPLSKGVTDGYVYAAVTGTMVNGKILVWWWNMAIADMYNIPLTNMRIRICSTSWTSNCSEWDAKSQVYSPYNVPISGMTPVMVYPTNPDTVVNGTLVPTSLSHVGLIGTTGGTNDGKQGGFDMVFLVGYIGLHSETHTNTFFDELYEQAYDDQGGTELPINADRPLGVISRAGDFFQTNVKFQLGDGTADTANLVVSESGKTIFFANVEPEHELGYVFVDPNSTHEIRLTLTDCVHFWTSQQSTHEIFSGVTNATYFKLDGCAFTNGGKATLPSYSTNRWVKTTKFANCGVITPGDGTFENNVISGATTGVLVSGTLTNNRMKNNSYNGCTDGIEFDTVQNVSLDGDQFSGNTDDIHFSGNSATITAGSFTIGRAYKILTVGTTDFTLIGSPNNTIGTKFVATGVGTGTGTATEVLLINKLNGANPTTYRATGTNGDVMFQNAVTVQITVLDDVTGLALPNAHVLLYKDSDKTTVILSGNTNASGIISTSYNHISDTDVVGWARQSDLIGTDYTAKDINGTISANGLYLTVRLKPISE